MKAKFKLEVSEYADYNFLLFGINCSEEEVRFCWLLNNALNVDFRRKSDVELLHAKSGTENAFPLFEYISKPFELEPENGIDDVERADIAEELDVIFQLVGNRNELGFLIPEHPRVDYFLIIRGELEDQVDADEVLKTLREIPKVHLAFAIEPESLKSKDNLIF